MRRGYFYLLDVARLRLRSLFTRGRVEQELDEELQFHLEAKAAEFQAKGMTPGAARQATMREFGGVEQAKESCRDTRKTILLHDFFQDLRYGARMLRKSPGFSAVAVLTLALGIGANTAIFSVVNAVLIQPLPYPNHDRVVRIRENHPAYSASNLTYATFLDVQRSTKSLKNAAAYGPWVFNLTGEGEPERIPGALVSANFFAALGTQAMLGRTLIPEEDTPGGNRHVAILGYGLWMSRYGGDGSIVGRRIFVNAEPFTVIGVMPRGFEYPEKAQIWCPLVPDGDLHANRRSHLVAAIAELPGKSNGDLQAATQELSSIANFINTSDPGDDDPALQLTATPLKSVLVAPVRTALEILIFSVGILLLIGCANIAGLLLSRSAVRRKEFAIRTAIGAGRGRVVRQLLAESVLLGLIGGAAGLGIAAWSLRILAHSTADMPGLAEVGLDWRVLLFTVAVTLATSILFGLAPAFSGAKTDVNASLKEQATISGRATGGGGKRLLLVPQFALATILLAGAGLLANSFVRLLRVDLNFNPKQVLTLGIFLSPAQYGERDTKTAVLQHELMEHIRATPDVRSAGLVSALPLTGGPATDFEIVGRPAPRPGDEPSADIRSIDPGYFSTMGIPLISGRNFTEHDNFQAAGVLIINQTMARKYWPEENPIGKRVIMKDWGAPLPGEIVGVVADVKAQGLDEPVQPMIYWPYGQLPQIFGSIAVRSDENLATLLPALKAQIWAVDKDLPVSEIRTMEEILSASLARRRIFMTLLAVFAGAALLLAAVGIYGLMAYSVNQRVHEIGLRLALGADRGDVLQMILGEGARIAVIGTAIGVAAALALTRLMSTMLFGVSATDPATLSLVATVPLGVAFLACYIPARRATRVDPMVALRHE
jgi:predicted permease